MTAPLPPDTHLCTGEMSATINAKKYQIRGYVQGIGYRPFVFRLAEKFCIKGWVRNQAGEVIIHAEGTSEQLQLFEQSLLEEAPSRARAEIYQNNSAAINGARNFTIKTSSDTSDSTRHILSDLSLCQSCHDEIFNPKDRRYAYTLNSCTECGPRYSIIDQLPYDRDHTSLKNFPLCPDCQQEYADPGNRRFHAETISCPSCGPVLYYRNSTGEHCDANAINLAIEALLAGDIIAVKGMAGYHLMCLADDDQSVIRLRQRKQRPHKPFAILINQTILDSWQAQDRADNPVLCKQYCDHLKESIRPILLVPHNPDMQLSRNIAPGLDNIGIMLPCTPLQELIIQKTERPLIATSANLSGEPIITDNEDIEKRLADVADGFLHHTRPTLRQADDPVYRIICDKPRPIRLGRGNAPCEFTSPVHFQRPLLALGGHMKNTIALAWDNNIVISPHNGDLESPHSLQVFAQTISEFQKLYDVKVQHLVCDAHPGYASHRYARDSGYDITTCYHHHAHASALCGEFSITEKCNKRWLVFTWDGIGYGEDGTLWGGEALLGHPGQWQRVASLRPFRIPGGEKTSREIWRTAYALCWQAGHNWTGKPDFDVQLLHKAWRKSVNAPQTSSAGRLFDAAAAMTGLLNTTSYEGQAAMMLEACANQTANASPLELPLYWQHDILHLDWIPLLPMLTNHTLSPSQRARCFHSSLAHAILKQALEIREKYGQFSIGLSGGVFQNQLLSEETITLLESHNFQVHLPERIPVNDAGLCFGQLFEVAGQINAV